MKLRVVHVDLYNGDRKMGLPCMLVIHCDEAHARLAAAVLGDLLGDDSDEAEKTEGKSNE